jgi:hypothetical protein
MVRSWCLFATGVLAGCGAGWHRPPEVAPGPWTPRQQVQVWHAGHAARWHVVIVGPDSITGIPFTRPAACDSCRVGLARAGVDSVRIGQPVAGFWKTVAVIMALPLTLALIWCSNGPCPQRD